MARHFATLYALLVATLVLFSWGQDQFLQSYGSAQESTDDRLIKSVAGLLKNQPGINSHSQLKQKTAEISTAMGIALDLMHTDEVTGSTLLRTLNEGHTAYLKDSSSNTWTLVRLDADNILAMQVMAITTHRSPAEWALTIGFYIVFALVVMIWVWPISRDLRKLEFAAGGFGNRNWVFNVNIKPRSQIYSLTQTFKKMAARIDELITSHKDMSNAVAHEIRTPLSRMKFEIELATRSTSPDEIRQSLTNIQDDIAAIDGLITATINYAILERADMALNIGAHDFTTLIPAMVDQARRNSPEAIQFGFSIRSDSESVYCDIYLFETLINNLLQNAARYATADVQITFLKENGRNWLMIDDDGKGIPEQDRRRVFDSFVQLDTAEKKGTGFGLGLAIVKRISAWHDGEVQVHGSPLGGARFTVSWPIKK